jgi:hypothetical protein
MTTPGTTNEEAVRAEVQRWFNRTVTEAPYYGETLAELLRYVLAVNAGMQATYRTLRPYLTPRCTECGQAVTDMTDHWQSLHIIVNGYVIVACEWYWVVDPNIVGIAGTWCDWAEGMSEEAKRNWIDTGKVVLDEVVLTDDN